MKSRLRAIIVSNTSKLGDLLINKIFHEFPEADINYWRSGAFSIETKDDYCFEMEPPSIDFSLLNFWSNDDKELIRDQINKPCFYLVEYYDLEFMNKVLDTIPPDPNTIIKYNTNLNEKELLKYIKKNIKN